MPVSTWLVTGATFGDLLRQLRRRAGLTQGEFATLVGFATNAEQSKKWLNWLENDHDNIRAALDWLLVDDGEVAQRMSGALREFWYVRGYFAEVRA